jgi:hypothetical protein
MWPSTQIWPCPLIAPNFADMQICFTPDVAKVEEEWERKGNSNLIYSAWLRQSPVEELLRLVRNLGIISFNLIQKNSVIYVMTCICMYVLRISSKQQ